MEDRLVRSASETMTQVRWYESQDFCDFILYAVIKQRIPLTTKTELTNIVRTSYISNTKSDEDQ